MIRGVWGVAATESKRFHPYFGLIAPNLLKASLSISWQHTGHTQPSAGVLREVWDIGTGGKAVNVAIAAALPPPNVEKLRGVLSVPPSGSTMVKRFPQQLD